MPPSLAPERPPVVDDLAAIAAGEQPQQGGYLLCWLCGRWFRSVGRHLQPGHGMSPEQYKELFELPVTRGLVAEDLREAFAERQSQLLRTNPEVRAAFALDDPASPERRRRQARGVQRKAETASRAGVQRSQQARIAALSRHNTARADQLWDQYDARARELGYRDLEHLLRDTAHLSYRQCAQLMGWSPARVYPWRLRYGICSTARQTRAAQRAQTERAQLAAVPPGVQPVNEHGRPRCLLCGQVRADLSNHLHQAHQLTDTDYRHRFQLPGDTPLVGTETQQARADRARRQAVRAAEASGRAKSAAARARWDAAARGKGYQDIAALLLAHPQNTAAAATLGITTKAVTKIRPRYLSDLHHGRTTAGPTLSEERPS